MIQGFIYQNKNYMQSHVGETGKLAEGTYYYFRPETGQIGGRTIYPSGQGYGYAADTPFKAIAQTNDRIGITPANSIAETIWVDFKTWASRQIGGVLSPLYTFIHGALSHFRNEVVA